MLFSHLCFLMFVWPLVPVNNESQGYSPPKYCSRPCPLNILMICISVTRYLTCYPPSVCVCLCHGGVLTSQRTCRKPPSSYGVIYHRAEIILDNSPLQHMLQTGQVQQWTWPGAKPLRLGVATPHGLLWNGLAPERAAVVWSSHPWERPE